MKRNVFTLKTILLGTIISLNISLFGNTPILLISPELPVLPQNKAEEEDGSNSEDAPGINSAGIISQDETICGPGIPDIIKNVIEPIGEIEGFLVFQWEQKIMGEAWVVIPGANGLDYEPASISTTTMYKRGCRQWTDNPWIYSNPVTKKIAPPIRDVKLSTTPVTCKDGSDGTIQAIVIGGTPGYMFDWIVSGETGNELTDVPAGLFNVEVTDQNGCTYLSDFVEVNEPAIGIYINEVFSFEPTCAGATNGAIFIEAFDGIEPYTYHWSNGGVEPSVVDIPSGFYHVTVTDALGCIVTKSDLVLNQPEEIKLNDEAVAATCRDTMDGSVILTAIGGTSPYIYVWSDGANGNIRGEMAAGSYSVDIFDANNCQLTDLITISQPEELEVSPFIVNNKICKASANVFPSGGTAPYTYEWDDGSIEGFKTGLCPGIYTVDITDSHGCKSTDTLEIIAEVTEKNISISVIVNPFYKEGNIIIKLPFDDYADVRVYSPTGQLVEIFMHVVTEENQEISLALDLDKYSNGVYILDVQSGGLSTSEKVIVSN